MRPTSPPSSGSGHDGSQTAVLPKSWWIYQGTGEPASETGRLTPWTAAVDASDQGAPREDDEYCFPRDVRIPAHLVDPEVVSRVNLAIRLNRPLLVTGDDGVDTSALAYRVSRELGLGRALRWRITESSTLADGLYTYDAVSHLRAVALHCALVVSTGPDAAGPQPGPAGFIRLGPLGTAMSARRVPRVLLIEGIDRADPDLPDSLAAVLDDRSFMLRELNPSTNSRITTDDGHLVPATNGRVHCGVLPIVVATSSGARDLPSTFADRCVGVHVAAAGPDLLAFLAEAAPAKLPENGREIREALLRRAAETDVDCTRRLLDALGAASVGTVGSAGPGDAAWEVALDAIWRWTAAPR